MRATTASPYISFVLAIILEWYATHCTTYRNETSVSTCPFITVRGGAPVFYTERAYEILEMVPYLRRSPLPVTFSLGAY